MTENKDLCFDDIETQVIKFTDEPSWVEFQVDQVRFIRNGDLVIEFKRLQVY